MTGDALGWWGVPLAVGAGAIRVSTPFLFVSLGEVVTETAGRINLGLEGTLVMGAMSGYAVSYYSGSPWLGVLAAGIVGSLLGALHAGICSLPKVNDIAVGIALRALSAPASPSSSGRLSWPRRRLTCPRSRSASGVMCRSCKPR